MSPSPSAKGSLRLPQSATNYGINLVGVVGALIALYVLHERRDSGSNAILIVCAAGVVPIMLLDVHVLRVHRRDSTGIDWDREPTPDLARCATKLLGLAFTVGLIALAYFVFPEYGDWYTTFWNVLRRFWLMLLVLPILYFWFVDGRAKEPHDAYWQLGRVLLGHRSDARPGEIPNHFRGWLVKAFYLPLFVVYVHGQLGGLIRWDLTTIHASNLRLYDFLNDLVYGLDVLYACLGYVLSFRIFDSHLRTAEPTMLGWCVALECYQPFWGGLFNRAYLHYEGIGFAAWLSDHMTLRWAWVAMIFSMDCIYVLATFAFGVRFSNLTHRGILTNGPYRFTKHPAYIAKNLSWWMITLPFIPNHGWVEALKSTLALGGVSAMYFMRARTEERHLSRDPTYVEYALWMNQHGALRFLNRIPFFIYRAPRSADDAPGLKSETQVAST